MCNLLPLQLVSISLVRQTECAICFPLDVMIENIFQSLPAISAEMLKLYTSDFGLAQRY